MAKYNLSTPVSVLPGVGKTREAQLSRLGIRTLRDLIYLFPRAYERRGEVKLLSQLSVGETEAFMLTVATEVQTATLKRGLKISKFKAFDDSGACEVIFFNSPYVKDVFHIGSVFRFYGKSSFNRRSIQLTNPKFEPCIESRTLLPLVPIYPLTGGVSSSFIEKLIKAVLKDVISDLTDPLPESVRLKNSLPVLSYALENIHFPESEEALRKSIVRLAFDEMLYFGMGVSMSSRKSKELCGIPFAPCDITPLLSLLPYELTPSQKNAVNDVYRDTVRSDKNAKLPPMSRIIVGDVGSGKTICAVAAMYIAVKSGYQAALMTPTEILSRQHYEDISKLLSPLGIKCEILLGATSAKEKTRIYKAAENGELDIIIGTHSLISDKFNFKNLGLVVTDEQHRFGIMQRASLKEKSKSAHMLVMSATPIPRTLALTMYGDLDVSRMTDMPKGRMRVDTFVVDEGYRQRLNGFIEKQVENGAQCYVVCPSIESSESTVDSKELVLGSISGDLLSSRVESNIKNAIDYADILRQKLPNLRIEVLHGRLKSKEKEEIMRRFSTQEIDVLVSTTVIEVGVNVPNASLMVVENADRFGLAQLHQLRGRVGRGTRKSYCVLVSDLNTEKSRARLEIMRTSYDGYEIAERDLLLRGPGDFFASIADGSMRQSGGLEFKLASLCDDSELFGKAFATAKEIVAVDPELKHPDNALLRHELEAFIIPSPSTIS